jgi:hypothetical protein
MNQFQYLRHRWWRKDRRSFRKPPNEFIQKIFSGNLEMERITTVLDEDIEELF